MSLTTAQAMAQFLANISPTENQRADVTSKVGSTRRLLAAAFPASSTLPINRTIMIGSADRGTMIRPVDDVDVMAHFVNKDRVFEKYRYDSVAFLQRIRTALSAKTSVRDVGARGQAVRIFYRSGAHVDIAPVFKWSGSGYGLPSGNGKWITTDPEVQAVWYTGREIAASFNLASLVKLTKRWNAVHSSRFASYHLEVMVASMFSKVGSDHRDGLKCFFDWGPNWFGVPDPAGHSGSLDNYMTTNARDAAKSRLRDAHVRALRALNAESAGNHAEAKRLWQIELGSDFPTS